jgi:hypothetical protein
MIRIFDLSLMLELLSAMSVYFNIALRLANGNNRGHVICYMVNIVCLTVLHVSI